MQKYVLGFCFSEDRSKVALIKKNKPEWQNGKLNGIGGKVEGDELFINAMRREFEEETGMYVHDWKEFATLKGTGSEVQCFVAFTNQVKYCQTQEAEQVFVLDTQMILNAIINGTKPYRFVHNLPYLIMMALGPEPVIAELTYPEHD